MKGGLWRRLRTLALTDVTVLARGLDRGVLEGMERVLLEADFGPAAFPLLERLEEKVRRGELRDADTVREWLTAEIAGLFDDGVPSGTLDLGDGNGPGVILVLGVNGVGKTTLTAKLAHRLQGEGHRVLVAAADTFRAAAGEQLRAWAERLGVPCVTGAPGGDPAAVAFDAVEAARARGADVVLVDTAGRLHTQRDLMDELGKVARVVGRRRAGAPHESLLVLDGTVGQNALQQGRTFAAAVRVSGLIVTKLDSTAKGGAVVGLRHTLALPVRFLGVGEQLDDLEVFDARLFAERLLAD